MLTGNWLDVLEETLKLHLPSDRRAAWGVADMSSNVFRSVCSALSALYSEAPSVGVVNAPEGSADGLLGRGGLIEQGGLWPIMQRVQFLCLGMREMFVRVSASGGRLHYRPVTPDMIYAKSDESDPLNPNCLHELRLRKLEKKTIWTYDVFDLRDPENPIYQIRRAGDKGDLGADLTEHFLGGDFSGAAYPFRDSAGVPRMPYAIYHATLTGDLLFDPFQNAELVQGALSCAVIGTYLLHLTRDCSHPQRFIVGATLAGTGVYDGPGGARRNAIASDPGNILVFQPDPDMAGMGSPQISQFSPGGDPVALQEVLTLMERKLAQAAGINAASVLKVSGDPRSGYAINMSRTDQREAQRRFAPSFKFGDIQIVELSAIMANRFLGTSFPETGYRIEYSSIPLSPEEAEGIRKDIIEKMNAGLLSKVEAIRRLHPDFSEDEARAYLRKIRAESIEFG